MLHFSLIALLAIPGILLITIIAYFKKSLSCSGAVAAFFVGLALALSGGLRFLIVLFAFFTSSSLLTHFRERDKKEMERDLYDKSGTRDYVQVLANGGIAFLIAVLYLFRPGEKTVAALFAAFAACNADTWASELGVLSKKPPVSILTMKKMQKGISGGVTLLGLTGAMAGSLLIAVVYLASAFPFFDGENLLRNTLFIFISGFLGSILDSILGMSLQPVYLNAETGRLTEKKFHNNIQNKKLKGFNFFSNDMVNFISSGLAACLILFFV